jgi:hypothetical protein
MVQRVGQRPEIAILVVAEHCLPAERIGGRFRAIQVVDPVAGHPPQRVGGGQDPSRGVDKPPCRVIQ